LASQIYEFREGSGQYPAANLPELVGRPYPLWNWCVAFRTALELDPVALQVAPPEAPASDAPMPAAPPAEAPPPATPREETIGDRDAAPEPVPVPVPEAAQPMPAAVPAETPPFRPVEPESSKTPTEPAAAETPAWQVLRGAAPEPPAPPPAVEPARGFLAWLRRLFGGG
jgi:hypothetical protein